MNKFRSRNKSVSVLPPGTLLTLWILTWRAASSLQGILCTSVFLSKAPAFGHLVGTRLNSILCSRGLSFPFCKRGFGLSGEHLVLQAGLPAADSKRWDRKCYPAAPLGAQLFLSISKHRNSTALLFDAINCLIQHWIEQILPLQKCKIGNILTEEGAMSTSEHSGAYSGVSQAAGSYKHARARQAKCQHTSQKEELWSCSVQKNKKEKKKYKVITPVPKKSTSYCMFCLTHSSWSKEKAVYC